MAAQLKWYGDRVIQEIQGTLDRRSLRAAEHLLSVAKAEAPVRTGRLRDSGHVERGERSGQSLVVFDAPYAGFVEFGTSRMRANPFFRRAIARSQDQIAAILAGQGESFGARALGVIRSGLGRIFGQGG